MKKCVLIEKNREYISIQYYLNGMAWIIDPIQRIDYFSTNIDSKKFGEDIKKKISFSRKLELKEFQEIYKSEEFKNFSKKNEEYLKEKFGYRTKKSIYKNMDFVTIFVNEIEYSIEPCHQDSLDGYTAIRDKNGDIIKFKYPITISDEKLGEAVFEAFKYCTSIYRR